MSRAKKIRKAALLKKKNARWSEVRMFLAVHEVEESRRFYARAVKFILVKKDWCERLRDHSSSDHNNLVGMIIEFNNQNDVRMCDPNNEDVVLERKPTLRLGRYPTLRTCKKHAKRFTWEMMRLIRELHPVNGEKVRDRVRCMPQFYRELVLRFLKDKKC